MLTLFARQGDLVFTQATITGDLTPIKGLVLAGVDSAAHTIAASVQYRTTNGTTFLRVVKAVTVRHAGRHLPITLPPGDYQVYPLRERGDATDRRVED